MSNVFADLIAPLSEEEFFRTYWEKSPLRLSKNSDALFENILTVEILDDFFQKGDISPLSVRLVKDGIDVPGEYWTLQRKLLNTKIIELVANDKVFAFLAEGTTVVINAAEKSISSLLRLCQNLEQKFHCRVQTNVYITPPEAQGFAAHYDTHDVLILQIIGKKQWQIYDSPVKLQTKRTALETPGFLRQAEELTAGDVLYLPRGTVHSAATDAEFSVHVTVSFYGRYGFHLIGNLAEFAEEDEFFRRSIPHLDADKSVYACEFGEKLLDLLEKYDAETLLEKQHRKFVETQKTDFQNRFTDLLQAEKLTLNSVVKRRENLSFVTNEIENNVEIAFAGEKIVFSKILMTALEICLQNEPFSIRDLQGLLTDKGKIEIVSDLVSKGFLRIERI